MSSSSPGSEPTGPITLSSARVDDPPELAPRPTPEYADAAMREAGEKLAALYERRDDAPSLELADEIVRLKSKMRKGPRLTAGEFLQDGRYWLLARTHRGSSDEYWKAWDRASGELALVRVFHGEWVTDPAAVKEFLSRGDALERLVHPGIGGVVDANRSDEGFVYLATRYYTTGDVTTAALDGIDALQVGVEVAQALKYAHEHEVIHGDLRPVNVLLSADGGAHVVGFLVSPSSSSDGATSLFRAPETTEPDYVPAAPADVFALGMTTLAALNRGQLPYWVIRDPGRLIKGLSIPESAKGVLTRATDWDLVVRYPTMAALLDDWLSDPLLLSQLAARALERGRNGVAAAHYEMLLTVQPSRAVEIRTILGDVYITTGAYDRALEHLLVALERTSDVESIFGRLAVVGKHTGQWKRIAEALWTQARARDAGRRVVLRMELARINEVELKEPGAAAETWIQVLADHRTPEQAEIALRALRSLAEARSDWSATVEYTRELLEYVSVEERSRLEYAIGKIYLQHLDDEDRGLAYIEAAEAREYHELDLSSTLQTIRARRGQWRKVIHLMVLQAASQDIAEASPTLLRAGIIASSVHLEEDAFTVYHALLERAPKHVVALRHVARMHHRAREFDRAVKFYERLWETYKGRDSEEPEASERAADCTAYAQLILRGSAPARDGRTRVDEAIDRVEEALRLNPNHIPALQLAGPLLLSRGDTTRAAEVLERLLALFKSVELSPQKIEACVGMGELAWVQGRLTAAMGWYNRALELDPFSAAGWWGLAKVALAARGGHPGADRAPWVMATPKRFTPFEAHARLLAGVLDPAAVRGWLERSALGRAFVEGGDSPMRLVCGVVDAVARGEVPASELFQRLGQAFPEWREPLSEVQGIWAGGSVASAFTVARSYAWSRRAVADDFDPLEHRSLLPTELALPLPVSEAASGEDAWAQLLGGAAPTGPSPFVPAVPAPSALVPPPAGPVGALVRDGSLWLALHRDRAEVGVGTDPDNALRIPDDASIKPRHARLFRQAGRIYVEALEPDAKVQVDGEAHGRWRLLGGERVTLGETRLQYQVFEDETRLPPPAAVVTRAAASRAPASRLPGAAGVELPLEGKGTAPEAAPPRDPPSTPPAHDAVRAALDSLPPARRPVTVPPPAPVASSPAPVPLREPLVPSAAPAPSRLLEPTAALRLDQLQASAEDDDSGAVSLAAVAEAPGSGPDRPVTVPFSAASDLQEAEPGTELPPLPEAEPPVVEGTVPLPAAVHVDLTVDDDPSEDEVIEGGINPNTGRFRIDGEEVAAEAVLLDVTGPMPAGGVQPPPEDDDDDDDDDSPIVDQTTMFMTAPKANPDVVPTLVEPPPYVRPAMDGPQQVESAFGFPAEGEGSEPGPLDTGARGPTAVPIEREESPPQAVNKPKGSLEFMSGADRGKRIEVGDQIAVGQSRQCGVSIPSDLRLSPIHCRLERSRDGFVLTDEGSANGTVVNGQRVSRFPLHGGEVIMVGRTVLRFRLERA